ncbi:MAG TPA: carboxymuconolactone decarboxylase family protein [Amycolatopsis sp.]|uniref:carboxymuconolactone decarboxylase family protein n=1 Tax=Amycolatopsis sp. TaxID=37632 RepID=UPI002F3EBB33
MTTTETSLDTVFAQLAGATEDYVGAILELTDREKTFLRVTADVCQGTLGLPFTAHVRTGLAAGVSTADVRELLRFVSYDCGYHAAAAGLERLADVEAELGIARPDAEPLDPELLTPGPSPLPDAVRARLDELDAHFTGFFDLQSRMRAGHGPGTLSERERGLVSLSVDVHYQTLADTFRTHVGRALRGGASPEDVRAALRFNAQFGVTRAWHAWEALNPMLADS